MDIKNHIDLLKRKYQKPDPELDALVSVLGDYVNNFSKSNYSLRSGVLFIKNTRPHLKTRLLLSKVELMQKLNATGSLNVLDIK